MKELNLQESEAVVGGLTGLETTFLFAAASYIIANWGDVKAGFADGFLSGYETTSA